MLNIVKETYTANKRIVFSGDNYSDEWHEEAEKRGLANLRQSPGRAAVARSSRRTVEVFGKYEVLSERELHSRYEVAVEQYITTINIEAETAASIARTMLLPAAIRWLATLEERQGGTGIARLTEETSGLVDRVHRRDLRARGREPSTTPRTTRTLDAAKYVQTEVFGAMGAVRDIADKLERIVPDDLWPLPKYSEILFIK